MTTDRYSLNREPRTSHNQLAEYLVAQPYRRSSIVREAKFPKTAQIALYREARLAVARQLCDGWLGTDYIRPAIERLGERKDAPYATAWTIDDSRRSIDILEAFGRHSAFLKELDRYDFRIMSGTLPHIMIEGVSVSVNISATVHRTARDGTRYVGGLSLFMSQTMANDEDGPERAAVSALLCQMFAEERLGHLGQADQRLCLALDVAGCQVFPAPKGQLRRRWDLSHACAEIARAWPTVTPPADYDGPEL